MFSPLGGENLSGRGHTIGGSAVPRRPSPLVKTARPLSAGDLPEREDYLKAATVNRNNNSYSVRLLLLPDLLTNAWVQCELKLNIVRINFASILYE